MIVVTEVHFLTVMLKYELKFKFTLRCIKYLRLLLRHTKAGFVAFLIKSSYVHRVVNLNRYFH